jgi:predicted MFS family arabinose efflux permease
VNLAPYRSVLALPGVTRLLVFAILARVPQTASGVVLTLHVVTTLRLGYAAAGLVAAAGTAGMAVGAPWRGRAVDRVGLRRALVPSLVVSTLSWALAPFATYPQLLVLAVVGGLLSLPVFTVVRQSLSVLVPADRRRTAFSLDGIGTELSFMVGPTVGVLLATAVSTRAALVGIAAATLAVGLALLAVNPPTRSSDASTGASTDDSTGAGRGDGPESAGLPRAAWFGPRLVAVLGVAAGATVVLAGTDVAVVAHLREHGAVTMTGLIFVAWGAGSMVGGLVYGGMRRELSPFWMLLLLGLLTVPVGLAPGPYALMLTILPAAALCAPVIAATAEGVSRLVPEQARGEAMGWHGSALQVGSGLGAPLAGVAMDAAAAPAGFATVGVAGALLAGTGLLLTRTRRGQRASFVAAARAVSHTGHPTAHVSSIVPSQGNHT